MRIVVRLIIGLIVVIAAAALAIYAIVWPPAPLALPEPGAVLDGVTLIEPGATRQPGMRLVVEGARIVRVEPAPAAAGPFAGMFVLPGLTDMHAHFPPPSLPGQTDLFAFLHLYYGVTAIRDAGDTDGQSTEPARQGVAAGRFPGPRIMACGPFVDGDPPLWRNSIVVHTPAEGRAAVRRVAELGYDCVKAYNELDAETLAAIRDEAHARRLPVIGPHAPVQRRGAVGCDDVDVSALLQERLHRGAVPVPGSLDKRRNDLGMGGYGRPEPRDQHDVSRRSAEGAKADTRRQPGKHGSLLQPISVSGRDGTSAPTPADIIARVPLPLVELTGETTEAVPA